MANLTGGTIANTDTNFNLPQASQDVTVDVIDRPELKIMRKYGTITDLSIKAAAGGKRKGDTIKAPNVYRHNSRGNDPTQSSYSQAKTLEYGTRELVLSEYKDTLEYERDETLSSQRDTHELLGKYEQQMLSEHMQNLVVFGAFQHLGGNTATSVTNPLVSDTAFTGTTLNNTRLLTSTIAPSSQYYAFGSQNAAGHSDASTIDATNSRLTMQDLQVAANTVDNFYAGIPVWQRLRSPEAMAILWVSRTGFTQLINQARATNADSTLSELRYSLLQGGKDIDGFGMNMTYLPGVDMLMCVVPDNLMPRASASGTENSNSRLAIITGGGALDFAIGNAMPGGGDLPSFLLRVDDKTFALDDKIYIGVRAIMAGKKAQLNGFGSNSGNTYDAATYVIAHSA